MATKKNAFFDSRKDTIVCRLDICSSLTIKKKCNFTKQITWIQVLGLFLLMILLFPKVLNEYLALTLGHKEKEYSFLTLFNDIIFRCHQEWSDVFYQQTNYFRFIFHERILLERTLKDVMDDRGLQTWRKKFNKLIHFGLILLTVLCKIHKFSNISLNAFRQLQVPHV